MAQLMYIVLLLFITSFQASEIACNTKQKLAKHSDENEEKLERRDENKDKPVNPESHFDFEPKTGVSRSEVSDSEKSKKDTTVISVTDESTNKKGDFDDLHNRLHHITGDDVQQSDEEKDKVKHKFKTYEELKKDFEDLRMAVKTDIELMNGILESYKELIDNKIVITEEMQQQQIAMLSDLEYLMHQIDNANEFIKIGGLTDVVLPSLNSTSPDVRSGTARLLGSAVQSNVAVQIAALEAGAVGILLRILALDKTPSVRSSTLYALSCLVRQFPIAQKQFVDEGGLTVLNKLFDSDTTDKLKIQVKVLTFINDLISEKQDAEKTLMLLTKETNSNVTATNVEEAKERLRQYNLIGLETRLQEQQWCSQLSSLLFEHVSHHIDGIVSDINSRTNNSDVGIEHDVIEKVIKAMISSYNLCLSDYEGNAKLEEIIRFLHLWYIKLANDDKDDSDNYFESVSEIIENFSWQYKIPLKHKVKDEL